MNPGKIYLIPNLLSPDSHARAIPPYNLMIIQKLQHFFVEDVRNARRFISSLKLGISIDSLQFYLLNKDTGILEINAMLNPVIAGQDAGVISEAGCPGIADPGSVLVAQAYTHHIQVCPLVGPSSILLALMASGMNGQSFVFHGYLPIQAQERKTKIQDLEKKAEKLQQTQIFIETPYRNNQMLGTLLETCKEHTQLCIAANIQAVDEFIQTKKIGLWKKQIPDLHKKPAIFLLQVV